MSLINTIICAVLIITELFAPISTAIKNMQIEEEQEVIIEPEAVEVKAEAPKAKPKKAAPKKTEPKKTEPTVTEPTKAVEAADTEPEQTEKDGMTLYGQCRITGYCACAKCCGKWAGGPTASGVMPTANHTVAMDLPFGTRIYIDGMGYYTVEDRGVSGMAVDVFCETHNACYDVTSNRDVWIVEDGE